jgi:hypothetical protein
MEREGLVCLEGEIMMGWHVVVQRVEGGRTAAGEPPKTSPERPESECEPKQR